jgi:hypothetical protein
MLCFSNKAVLRQKTARIDIPSSTRSEKKTLEPYLNGHSPARRLYAIESRDNPQGQFYCLPEAFHVV